MRLDARLHDLLRQDAPAASDVDLLAVVRPGRPITRALYREWEDKARAWDGRDIDLHLVHLPMADDRVSGCWADVVRESQEVVELGLKGLLPLTVPRISRHPVFTRGKTPVRPVTSPARQWLRWSRTCRPRIEPMVRR